MPRVEHSMPMFELRPKNRMSPAWHNSTYDGVCRVVAESSSQARDFASETFKKTEETSLEGDDLGSPWTDESLASCVSVSLHSGREYDDGLVLIPAPRISDGSGNSETSSSILADSWQPVLDKGGSGANTVQADTAAFNIVPLEAEVRVGGLTTQPPEFGPVSTRANEIRRIHLASGKTIAVSSIDQATVEHVLSQRAVLSFQAKLLADFVDDLLGPAELSESKKNAPSLGVAFFWDKETAEDDLRETLAELRDELRRLSNALENATVDRTILREVREIGMKSIDSFCTEFARESGKGIAKLLVGDVALLLERLRAVKWSDLRKLWDSSSESGTDDSSDTDSIDV